MFNFSIAFMSLPPNPPPLYNVILISLEFHFFEKSIDIYLLWKYEKQSWQLRSAW